VLHLTNDRLNCSGLLLLSTIFVACWAYYLRYRHLSLSVRRKITVNVFYSTLLTFFKFLSRFFTFLTYYIFGGTFFHLCFEARLGLCVELGLCCHRMTCELRFTLCFVNVFYLRCKSYFCTVHITVSAGRKSTLSTESTPFIRLANKLFTDEPLISAV